MNSTIQNVFSVIKGERNYIFHVPDKAPFGEALDALFDIITGIADMQKAVIDAAKNKTSSSTPPASIPPQSAGPGADVAVNVPATPVDATLAN